MANLSAAVWDDTDPTSSGVYMKAVQPASEPCDVVRALTRRADLLITLGGLVAVDALGELEEPSVAVLAPVNSAYDRLPAEFDGLLADPSLVEARFDLFEFLVLPRGAMVLTGGHFARVATLQGEHVTVDGSGVRGPHGAARILETIPCTNGLVLVIDAPLLPADPSDYEPVVAQDGPPRA